MRGGPGPGCPVLEGPAGPCVQSGGCRKSRVVATVSAGDWASWEQEAGSGEAQSLMGGEGLSGAAGRGWGAVSG